MVTADHEGGRGGMGGSLPKARHCSTSFSRAESPEEVFAESQRVLRSLQRVGRPTTLFAYQNGLCFHGLQVDLYDDGGVEGWLSPALVLERDPDGELFPGLAWLVDRGWEPYPSSHPHGGLCETMAPYATRRCLWCDPPPADGDEWCCAPALRRTWEPAAAEDVGEMAAGLLVGLSVVLAAHPLWLHYDAIDPYAGVHLRLDLTAEDPVRGDRRGPGSPDCSNAGGLP